MPGFDPVTDYPLGTRRPELVRTPSGLALDDLDLEALRGGRLRHDDLRATPETLRRQAEIARAAGREELAENLERAAELTAVPDGVILDVYTALRPGRSSVETLEASAARLEQEFGASKVARFVRETIESYRDRGVLR